MIYKPWWETYPGRFEEELSNLKKEGIEYCIDDEAYAKGVLCLDITMKDAGKLRVVFPDLYPYFRFEIYAPELNLPHHQNPFQKNLCMIGRRTENWHVNDFLATFLLKRLPQVLKAGQSDSREEVAGLELQQAEPISDYFTCHIGSGVIVNSEYVINPSCQSGRLLIGITSKKTNILQGVVIDIMDENGNRLMQSNNKLQKVFQGGTVSARWLRLSRPPHINNPAVLFNHLLEKTPYEDYIDNNPVKDGILQIRAAIFPEETRAWRKVNQGWIFVCKFESRIYGKKKKP